LRIAASSAGMAARATSRNSNGDRTRSTTAMASVVSSAPMSWVTLVTMSMIRNSPELSARCSWS
jgi:hypothetical protein